MPFRESGSSPADEAFTDLVVLRTFLSLHEAEFAKAQLAGHEIEARVEDSMTAGVHPWLAPALGGVRLLVSHTNEQRANDVLDALASESAAADEARTDDEKLTDEADATARRALTSAVFGSAVLPVVAHAYSLYLALGVERARLSKAGRRRLAAAVGIDVTVLGLVAWLIAR